MVAEVKFRPLPGAEGKEELQALEVRWARSSLAARLPRVRFEILDAGVLTRRG